MTLEELTDVVIQARKKGAEASSAVYERMCDKNPRRGNLRGLCGGAHIMIKLDGRTRLARLLKMASQKIDDFSFGPSYERGIKLVHIRGMHDRQEREVDIAATGAVLAVLMEKLRVFGYLETYYS